MGFASYADIDDSRIHHFAFAKQPNVALVANGWYDTSMWSGIPAAQFYASEPLVAATLDWRRGIRHTEPDPSTSEHLLSAYFGFVNTATNTVSHFMFADWLLYYPFLDADSVDTQTLDNTVTLPRSTDGDGVRVMLVAQSPQSLAGAWTMTYTNQDGVSGRVTSGTTATSNGASQVISAGNATGRSGPFVHLAEGDHGVRSVEDFTFTTAPGGLVAIVLVKPIANASNPEVSVMSGSETVFAHLPLIPDGACLHYLHFAASSMSNIAPRSLLTTIRS